MKKIFFSAKIASGEALFFAFRKGQKSTSKFWKTPELKNLHNKTFKCSKLLLFKKKIRLTWWKLSKTENRWLFNYYYYILTIIPPKQFWRKKNFLQNFIFYHPFESINLAPAEFLLFKEKNGHCYPLNISSSTFHKKKCLSFLVRYLPFHKRSKCSILNTFGNFINKKV